MRRGGTFYTRVPSSGERSAHAEAADSQQSNPFQTKYWADVPEDYLLFIHRHLQLLIWTVSLAQGTENDHSAHRRGQILNQIDMNTRDRFAPRAVFKWILFLARSIPLSLSFQSHLFTQRYQYSSHQHWGVKGVELHLVRNIRAKWIWPNAGVPVLHSGPSDAPK